MRSKALTDQLWLTNLEWPLPRLSFDCLLSFHQNLLKTHFEWAYKQDDDYSENGSTSGGNLLHRNPAQTSINTVVVFISEGLKYVTLLGLLWASEHTFTFTYNPQVLYPYFDIQNLWHRPPIVPIVFKEVVKFHYKTKPLLQNADWIRFQSQSQQTRPTIRRSISLESSSFACPLVWPLDCRLPGRPDELDDSEPRGRIWPGIFTVVRMSFISFPCISSM